MSPRFFLKYSGIRKRQMYSRVFDWSTKKGKSQPSLGQLRSGRAICYELYQAGNECYSRSSELVRSKQSCLMILLLSLNSDWISVSFLILWLNILFKAFLQKYFVKQVFIGSNNIYLARNIGNTVELKMINQV